MKVLLPNVSLFVLIMVPSLTTAQPETLNWIKSINVSATSGDGYDLSFGFNEEATDFENDTYGAQFCSDGIQNNSIECLFAGICEGGEIEWAYGTLESFCGFCSNSVCQNRITMLPN